MSDLLLTPEDTNEEYKKVTKKKRRISHCFKCKEPLINSVNIDCLVCHWMICKCGVCGCGSF